MKSIICTWLFYHKWIDNFTRVWVLPNRTWWCNNSFISTYCNFRQTIESQPRCEEPALYCQECDKTFSKACNLKRHLQSAAVHLKEDAQPVESPNSFKPFSRYRAMRKHWIRCTRKLQEQWRCEVPAKRRKITPSSNCTKTRCVPHI